MRTRRQGTVGVRAAIAVVAGAALAACGAGDEAAWIEGDPDEAALEDQGSEEDADSLIGSTSQAALTNCGSGALGSPLVSHSCTHVTLGPYGSKQARTTSPFQSFTATHTYYTVTFQDTTAPYVGRVRYKAPSTGDFAVFFDPSPGLAVTVKLGSTTIAPDPAISPDPGSTTCSGIAGYRVFPLVKNSTYDITFSSTSASTVHALLEEVAPYRVYWYRDNDGDTWGQSGDRVQTACVPPAGYTASQGSDCNDANASVNPVAPETCGDGVDSNCNGNDCT
jgi:hypothetical protein